MFATPVQRRETAGEANEQTGEDAAGVQAAAQHGVQGSARELPFRREIEAATGADLSGVQAHIGGPAAEGAAAMGAEAFATGEHVAFAREPDIHTAAHEATHVLQQRRGVSLLGGVGQSGDAYEQEAEDVAGSVQRGEPAHLRSQQTRVGGATASPAGVQRKPAGKSALPTLSFSRDIAVGDITMSAQLEAKLQVEGKRGEASEELGPMDGVASALEGQLDLLAKKIGASFLKGKMEVEGFEHLSVSLKGSAAEMAAGDGKTGVSLGKIGVEIAGTAPELLDLGELSHLRGQVSVQVSGSLTWNPLDGDKALKALYRQQQRATKHLNFIEDGAEKLQAAQRYDEKLVAERDELVKRLETELAERDPDRFPDQKTFRAERDKLHHRRHVLNTEIKNNRRSIHDLYRQIDLDRKEVDGARKRMLKMSKSVRGRANKALARTMAAMSKKLAGRILLKAIPIIGWASAILDVVDIIKAIVALVEADWGEEGMDGVDAGEDAQGGESEEANGGGGEGEDAGGGSAQETSQGEAADGERRPAATTDDASEETEASPSSEPKAEASTELHLNAKLVLAMLSARRGKALSNADQTRLGQIVPANLSDRDLDELQERIEGWSGSKSSDVGAILDRVAVEIERIQNEEPPPLEEDDQRSARGRRRRERPDPDRDSPERAGSDGGARRPKDEDEPEGTIFVGSEGRIQSKTRMDALYALIQIEGRKVYLSERNAVVSFGAWSAKVLFVRRPTREELASTANIDPKVDNVVMVTIEPIAPIPPHLESITDDGGLRHPIRPGERFRAVTKLPTRR